MNEPSTGLRPTIHAAGSESLAGVPTPDGAESRSAAAPVTSNRHPRITCGGCDASWTALGAAHCSGCHRTFSSVGLFDRHRTAAGGEHGSCLDPGRLVNASTGERVAFLRDGIWRGPEMTDEVKARKFGGPR